MQVDDTRVSGDFFYSIYEGIQEFLFNSFVSLRIGSRPFSQTKDRRRQRLLYPIGLSRDIFAQVTSPIYYERKLSRVSRESRRFQFDDEIGVARSANVINIGGQVSLTMKTTVEDVQLAYVLLGQPAI